LLNTVGTSHVPKAEARLQSVNITNVLNHVGRSFSGAWRRQQGDPFLDVGADKVGKFRGRTANRIGTLLLKPGANRFGV
jgi:hypothetical protein